MCERTTKMSKSETGKHSNVYVFIQNIQMMFLLDLKNGHN